MASQEACSAAGPCGPSASSIGVLPIDVLYDVLVHLPAKTLCRLRAVSRSWRSLLIADPHFAKAHASRHPCVVAVFSSHADTYDLSGNRLRRMIVEESGSMISGLCTHGNLACITLTQGCPNRVRLINLATGAASVLPSPDEVEYAEYMLGQVTSSGEYKLLCVTLRPEEGNIFVLGIGGSHQQWKRKESPPVRVTDGVSFSGRKTAVVQGTVYFLATRHWDTPADIYKDSLVSFDLETEEWAPTVLPGPLGDRLKSVRRPCNRGITLAELSGYLVIAHTDDYTWSMDLWFLVEGQWCKRHHIWLNVICDSRYRRTEPFFVFDDGRILLWTYDVLQKRMVLRVYDTRTRTRSGEATDVIRDWYAIGLCTGSLLCP